MLPVRRFVARLFVSLRRNHSSLFSVCVRQIRIIRLPWYEMTYPKHAPAQYNNFSTNTSTFQTSLIIAFLPLVYLTQLRAADTPSCLPTVPFV
jgi:hypothetical protein